MNQYLFLFPIREYFEACLNQCRLFQLERYTPHELIDIINARYRNPNYKINWLLFSQEKELSKPDLNLVPPYIEIKEEDNILVAGMSFKIHISEKQYPDPDFILNQLSPTRRLVIGGFHQQDCVEKIARRSYEKGIETFVDEDTTDLFFPRKAFDDIPLIREKWNLKELCIPEELYEITRELRKDSPWLVQN